MSEEPNALDRRSFLRRAALTGAGVAWAAPIVQTVAARPAFAQTGSPSECRHSIGPWFTNGQQQNTGTDTPGGCRQACKHATQGNLDSTNSEACTRVCDAACPSGSRTDDRVCCDGSFCESTNWVREGGRRGTYRVCYTGGATCSPIVCG